MAEPTRVGTPLEPGAPPALAALPTASGAVADSDPVASDGCAELVEAQLRDVVERAWSRLASILDRLIATGRRLDRDLLVDLARFLESSWPAVRAYERLVRKVREEALATLEAPPPGRLPGDGT